MSVAASSPTIHNATSATNNPTLVATSSTSPPPLQSIDNLFLYALFGQPSLVVPISSTYSKITRGRFKNSIFYDIKQDPCACFHWFVVFVSRLGFTNRLYDSSILIYQWALTQLIFFYMLMLFLIAFSIDLLR